MPIIQGNTSSIVLGNGRCRLTGEVKLDWNVAGRAQSHVVILRLYLCSSRLGYAEAGFVGYSLIDLRILI